MAKRSQPHLILSPKGEAHRVTSKQWNQMRAEGIIEPKRLCDGELSRRVAVLTVAAQLYHSWIAIERAWLTHRAESFSKSLDFFRQQELSLKLRADRVCDDVAEWSITQQSAPGLPDTVSPLAISALDFRAR